MSTYAASVFRDDSVLWDAIIIGSLLLMAAMVVAVFLDIKDGL